MGGTITYYYLENFFEYMGGVILFGKFFYLLGGWKIFLSI